MLGSLPFSYQVERINQTVQAAPLAFVQTESAGRIIFFSPTKLVALTGHENPFFSSMALRSGFCCCSVAGVSEIITTCPRFSLSQTLSGRES